MTTDEPMPDFGALLSQLGQVQQNLQAAQESAAAEVVEGSAGGGTVKVKVTGGLEFQSVTIDPSVVDPADIEMLQDLVLAAVRDAIEQAHDLAAEALGGVGLPAGLGLPGGPGAAGNAGGAGLPAGFEGFLG